MTISPEQCRAARGLLGWSQDELRKRARMARRTIADFEQGIRRPYPRTLEDLVRVFESAGVEFFEGDEIHHGEGVRFKAGVKIPRPPMIEGEEQPEPSDDSRGANDQDIDPIAYWRARPEQWAKLTVTGKRTLYELFGSELFGNGAR
jgi:transcriptional regulator with XRE-family HTH domain